MKNSKASKIKEIIFRNFPLKILALVMAVVIWIVVMNVDDPVKNTTITGIPVTLLNEESLIDKGYTYQVETGSVISIVVKAPQTIVDELKYSDFYAYADLSQKTDEDACKIYVSCTKEEVADQVDIVSLRTEYVRLNIDNKISKDFTVATEYTGEPESGYIVSDISASPSTITVSGAEATIDQIDHVKITYDISNMNQSITENVAPIFYDADGNVVDTSILELSRDNIRLDVTILPTKTIAVNYALSGELPDDYEVESDSANISSVTIAGTKDDLASIDAIDIPAGGLDITGLTEDSILSVSLQTYLSDRYFIVSDTNILKVEVKIKHITTSTIEIPLTDITIDCPEGFTYEILGTGEIGGTSGSEDMLSVEVSGEDSIMEQLTAADVKASVALSVDADGSYDQRQRLILKTTDQFKNEITISGTYYILVNITEKVEETSADETAETGEEQSPDSSEISSEGEETASAEDSQSQESGNAETNAEPEITP